MAEIDPTRIMQKSVDLGQEVSPDGGLITQTAAPTANRRPSQQIAQPQPDGKGVESIKDLPVDDGGNKEAATEEQPIVDDAKKEPSIEDFFASKATDESPLVDKTVRPEDKPKPAEELKTGLEDVKIEQKKDEVKPAPVQKVPAFKDNSKLAPRDVTGIPDDIAEHLKNDMSRPAFEKLKPVILENLQLKQKYAEVESKLKQYKDNGIPESYYEHPNAFLLHPDYLSTLETADKAQRIAQHWEKQYADVKAGAAEFDVIDVDPQGNLVITGKMKADQNAEPLLMGAINRTQRQSLDMQAKLQTFPALHKERSSQVTNWVDQFEKQDFPIFETSPDKDKYLMSVANIMKSFHPSLQANPLARPLAKAKFVIATLGNFINQIKAQQNGGEGNGNQPNTQTANNQPKTREQLIAEQQRRAGPTSGSSGGHDVGNENGKNKPEITIDAFNRAKEDW